MKRKDRTAEKRQPIPSGLAGAAPRRRAGRGGCPRCSCCLFAACAWLRRASARRTCLCQAHATVPLLKNFFVLFKEIAFFESLCYTMLYPARGWSMKFKDKVVKAREILFISQKTLADKVGVSFATINRWEQGHTEPTLITKAKFEKFCHENNIKF